MPAIRTQHRSVRSIQEPMPYRALQTAYLESARSEFSLRKRNATYSPLSPPTTPSPPSTPPPSPISRTPTRSKSSASAPQKKKKAPNAFILYRSYVLSQNLLPESVTHQNDVSRRVAELWRAETDEVKKKFFQMAIEEKARMESEGILSHSHHGEKAVKVAGSKSRRHSSSSSWTPSPSLSPDRRHLTSLTSPPPSPQSTSSPSISPNPTASLSLFPPPSNSGEVLDALTGLELLPADSFPLDWSASSSCMTEPFPSVRDEEPPIAGSSFSEADAWGAVRAFLERNPTESRTNVGLSVSIAADTGDELASLFENALDFSRPDPALYNPFSESHTPDSCPTLGYIGSDYPQDMQNYDWSTTPWL